jgi:hypothetical protein
MCALRVPLELDFQQGGVGPGVVAPWLLHVEEKEEAERC